MAIYTKQGDKGETGTLNAGIKSKERVSKDSLVVETLGAIDELNSFLGVVKTSLDDKKTEDILNRIQKNLLTIGSITGGAKLRFSSVQTKKLERLIDDLEGSLPVLKNFVIPGGKPTAAQLQYARALARRVERKMVALSGEVEFKNQLLQYLNRLSDALFMLARETNFRSGVNDDVWLGGKKD